MLSIKVKEVLLNINYNDGIYYCIPFDIFLDEHEDFFDFCSEIGAKKNKYLSVFKQILEIDQQARILVIIYDAEGNDFIYSNDIYIISDVEQKSIESVFDEHYKSTGEYISPSEIDELDRTELNMFSSTNSIISIVDDNTIIEPMLISAIGSKHVFLLSWD